MSARHSCWPDTGVSVTTLVFIVLLVVGLTRLRMDADVFNLLPRNSPIVDSLRLYQQDFGSSNELILLLRATDSASSTAAVESFDERSTTSRTVISAVGITTPSRS